MKRFCVIFGTRPEGIKLFPLVRALRSAGAAVLLLSTAQHTDMLEGVYEAFSLYPDLTLGKRGKSEGMVPLLSRVLSELERTLSGEQLDGVIVQGDTLSAYAGALYGFLSGISVYHVEAGLRSHDILAPYPEETFRRSIAAMATLHFAPTVYARENLLREGITPESIHLVGNTVLDALRCFDTGDAQKALGERHVLLTLHRRETLGAGHREILLAIRELAHCYPDIPFFFPMHENPRIRSLAIEILGHMPNVRLSSHLPPNEFYKQLFASRLVLTDSGGIQEEAALLGIPTLVLRECTEREAELRGGYITLAGTKRASVISHARPYLEDDCTVLTESALYERESPCRLIADILLQPLPTHEKENAPQCTTL